MVQRGSMAMTAKALTKGEQTRARILDFAGESVLQKGFVSTSIDELIADAGITKSGFFYHFRDKNDLARGLVQRYLDNDNAIFADLFARADALHDDPLQSFLIFLKLLAGVMEDLPKGHPGCIISSFCYQDQLFSRDIREMTAQGVRAWRERIRPRLDKIAERYPPKIPVDLDTLAYMLSAAADGGIVISKVLAQPRHLPDQILIYRRFVEAVFLGTPTPQA